MSTTPAPESSPPSPWRIAVPSAITLGGIFFGLWSMALAQAHPYGACLALIGACMCDMADGRVARWLGARSAFGAELDSLADIVSFGLAPAWLTYRWSLAPAATAGLDPWLLVAFAFVAAGAVRLARFNTTLDVASGDQFVGLPIPMAALLCVTPIMASHELGIEAIARPLVMSGVMLSAAALMVSPLPLPSYKRFPSRALQVVFYGLIAGGLLLLVLRLPGGAVLLGFVGLYLLIGLWRALAR